MTAPGRAPLSYPDLLAQVRYTVGALNRRGVGRNDRVAIVLPNGPEMATAFVGIASGATAAPLNPAYRRSELRFYMEDLGARALVVLEGSGSEAVAAAAELGVEVLGIREEAERPAGTFTFVGDAGGSGNGAAPPHRARPAALPEQRCFAGPEDVALVLHTSGTTSRPKIVPLTHRNVCASAVAIASTLALTPEDRCLNVMPLFHIHGLMAAVLASLSAGASVFCTPGFNALRFFAWLREGDPTWYTAVPTMHQAILARAEGNRTPSTRPDCDSSVHPRLRCLPRSWLRWKTPSVSRSSRPTA